MSQLLDLIKRHEGFRKDAYWDKTGQEMRQGLRDFMADEAWFSARKELGHLTIGYGFNLEAGISEELATVILRWQVMRAVGVACEYPWYDRLGGPNDLSATPRQAVIVSMIYQLGPTGFAGFKRVIAALKRAAAYDTDKHGSITAAFSRAADEMEDSAWHRQTPQRCEDLSKMMRTGEW